MPPACSGRLESMGAARPTISRLLCQYVSMAGETSQHRTSQAQKDGGVDDALSQGRECLPDLEAFPFLSFPFLSLPFPSLSVSPISPGKLNSGHCRLYSEGL